MARAALGLGDGRKTLPVIPPAFEFILSEQTATKAPGGSQACAPMVLAVYVQQQRESMLPDHVVQRYADPW
jgi:hypothetical protein